MLTFTGQIKQVKSTDKIDGKEYDIRITSWEAQAIQLDEFVGTDRIVEISVEEA